MNAQQLRNSILQEAIEGRLVPQDPNDEPASALLERIREEKKRLVKEGKLKKKDLEETPISEDEMPFEIPKGWEWVRFLDVFQILNGDRGKNYPSKSKLSTSGIPFISALNLQNNSVLKDDRLLCLTEEQYNKLGNGKLHLGDMVVCIRGSLGKHGIYPFNRGAIASSLVIVRQYVFFDLLFKYLNIYLDSPLFFEEIKKYNNGTAQPNLAAESLKLFLIPLPPLAEQKRIVAKIEELLPKVEEYGKAQDALDKLNEELPERLKKSILQEAIEGRLVPQDPNDEPASVLLNRIREEKKRLYKAGLLKKKEIIEREIYEDEVPFTLPDGWLWTKIDNVAFVTKLAGFEYTKYIADNLVPKENGIPLFKGKNVQNGKIVYEFEAYIPVELSNELKRSQINKKCLLTPYVGTIGNIGIHDKSGVYHLGSNVGKIEFYNGDNLNILEEYVKYYLMSSYGYDELTKYKKATAQESISIEAIRDVFLPLPPLAEQHRIVEKIEEVFKEIDKLKK